VGLLRCPKKKKRKKPKERRGEVLWERLKGRGVAENAQKKETNTKKTREGCKGA